MLLVTKPSERFPYRVEEKIGEGAMGEVYRAVETSLGRQVAIKILKREFISSLAPAKVQEAMSRFEQEARAAAKLSHPGITTIYRVDVYEDTPYIAMEWLDGDSLERVLEQRRTLPVAEVARLGIDLLETLAAAHEQGVIHRDIKPGNLMLLKSGRLKIADFGVARVAGSDLVQTQAGAILGTPFYASPEQVRGEDIDERADIYSAGVVLYEALTGVLPYQAETLFELIHQLVSDDEPPPPEAHDPSIPAGLSVIVQTAMSKRKATRFARAGQMAAALRPFAQDASDSAMSMSSSSGPASRLSVAMDSAVAMQDVLAPTVLVEAGNPAQLVAGLIERWPGRALGRQVVKPLIERLVERPLHAPAFAGAARIGPVYCLFHDGLIYAMFRIDEHGACEVGDAVYETLPETAEATLHPVPEPFHAGLIVSLASLLHRPKVRHQQLDSSFVDLVQLTGKLMREQFDGALCFEHQGELAYLLLERGKPVLHLFSGGWPVNPQEHPWPTWIAQASVQASVHERRVELSALSYRRELAEVVFDVTPPRNSRERAHIQLSGSRPDDTGGRGQTTMTMLYTAAPMYSFLEWMMNHLPHYFEERDRTKKWKYLASWVPLVKRAVLHHHLARPGTKDTDFFDLVTYENDTRVLHLAHRIEHGSADALQGFVDRALEAKRARIKTGDVGGACLVAPAFDDEALALYERLTSQEEKKSFFFSLQDSVTGYEGFVRIGARRGFHLLLIRQTESGFEPVLL